MTLHATRDGRKITVHHAAADGHEHHATEDWQHVKHFADQLNVLIAEAEAQEQADHEAGKE